jgi:thioredoxin reductase (NADPH)
MSSPASENVIIVGSGPAGYTAALYTARADLNPLVVEGWAWGGLLQQTTDVENFPGFPSGIMGPELMTQMREQAGRFGARLEQDEVTELALSTDGGLHKVDVGGDIHYARTVILAMGAQHKKLGVEGEQLLSGRGISYCATCDAAFFRDVPTIVVGGGDSAMEDAIFLSKFSSKVMIVHRRNEFRASQIMEDRARATENIEFLTPYSVDEFLAGESGTLNSVRLKHSEDGSTQEIKIAGAFVAVGHVPQSQLVADQLQLDDEGFVKTEGRSTLTGIPGVFAAGDLVDHTYRQAITAAGSGCQAALDAEWYLRDNPAPKDADVAERVTQA